MKKMDNNVKQKAGKQKKALEKPRHKTNPFLEGFEITTRKQRVSIGSGHDLDLVSKKTGEVIDTHVVSYRKVDDAEFIKLFTANISLTFDLNLSGRKVFDMLVRVMQKNSLGRDQVYLDETAREDFVSEHKVKLSPATFYRGIDNLILQKIIAKSTRTNIYFINPNMVFNGDRIAFTQVVERQSEEPEGDAHTQQSLGV